MKIIFVALILTNLSGITFCQNEPDRNKELSVIDSTSVGCVTNQERYDNFCTQNSFIEVQLKDFLTEENFIAVLSNIDFAIFVAFDRGYAKKNGKFYEKEVREVYYDRYRNYMIQNKEKEIVTDIAKFKKFMEYMCRGDYIVQNKMSILDLGVNNRNELLGKYFFQEYEAYDLKEQYIKDYYNNAAFKALLIDLGYDVRSSDSHIGDNRWYLSLTPMRLR